MGRETGIEYCHHTWSPWWGCRQIAEGCRNCYAKAFAERTGRDCWNDSPRMMMSDAHWRKPPKWNQEAFEAGERRRVFVSMCDPFEAGGSLVSVQHRFEGLIRQTQGLDWLLWTKRPEWISFDCLVEPRIPPNAWLGISASTQAALAENWEYLSGWRPAAPVLAWSLEPLIESIDIVRILALKTARPDWVIVGGESGPRRRPFRWEWAAEIAEACAKAGIACWVKQDGGRFPGRQGRIPDALWRVKQLPGYRRVTT